MDIAAYVVAAIGGILLAFAGSHRFQNMTVTIVAFGTGAILVVVGGCLYWQDAEWKREQRDSPANNQPVITVEIGNTLDPSAPLETRFIVTNHSESPVNEAWTEVEMWDARFSGPLFAQPDFTRFEIKPHAQITVDGRFLTFGVIYLKNPAALLLQITIHYKVGTTDAARYVRFRAERRTDGTYAWFPAGEGKPLRPEELPTEERPDDK